MALLKTDQLQARKNRDSVTANLLTTLLGEAGMIGKNAGNRETTDDEVIAVVTKFIKNIDETIKHTSATDELTLERRILMTYMPKQLTDDELKLTISQYITEQGLEGPKSMGIVMKYLKDTFSGQYDGKAASTHTRELL